MLLQIGMYSYLLIKSCASLGDVKYPLDDKAGQRRLSVCTDYGAEQAREIFMHEVMHACLHNHPHSFKTRTELEKHVEEIPSQTEEPFVSNLAACMLPALEDTDALKFFGLE